MSPGAITYSAAPMKFFDAGQSAEGFIAVGQQATGVIAIGQLATGVIAIGQLARGFIVVGQLALGVLAFGQLSVSLTWGGGMIGVAGLRARPSLLVWGVFGAGNLFRNGRLSPRIEPGRWSESPSWLNFLRVLAFAGMVALVATVGLGWLPGFVEGPATPPPPTFAPGTR